MDFLTQTLELIISFFVTILDLAKSLIDAIIELLQGVLRLFGG